jgi:hypothetical protein
LSATLRKPNSSFRLNMRSLHQVAKHIGVPLAISIQMLKPALARNYMRTTGPQSMSLAGVVRWFRGFLAKHFPSYWLPSVLKEKGTETCVGDELHCKMSPCGTRHTISSASGVQHLSTRRTPVWANWRVTINRWELQNLGSVRKASSKQDDRA